MNTVTDRRRNYRTSRKRLDRARRLWRWLIAPRLLFGGDDALIAAVAQAKESGLYARSTYNRDIAYVIVRSVYRRYHDGSGHNHWIRWNQGHFPRFFAREWVFTKKLRAI